jgi:broad specificity phosphatase PhoE
VLILVRHGQTTANARGVFLGRSDPPLTEFGRRQADALAAVDGVRTARRVIASPLTRAQQTAVRLGPPVESDGRWIEMDYGEYEGLTWTDVPLDTEAAWRADSSWTPPRGESLLTVAKRVREADADQHGAVQLQQGRRYHQLSASWGRNPCCEPKRRLSPGLL